ncbi:MAG: copper oxidase [Thermoanaerobaculia bacterium]
MRPFHRPPRSSRSLFRWVATAVLLALSTGAAGAQTCNRTLTANVVAFDQVFFWNRLGAVQPQGMMYALRRDVVPISGTTLSPGNVKLRADKRPRPIVLRMNVGDCLRVNFQNLLAPTRTDNDQAATRWASFHPVGLNLVNNINDDGSYVGQNTNSLVDVGMSATYTYYGAREGEHVVQSLGAAAGGEGDGGQVNAGLFGAIIVEPVGSMWYRSQLSRADYALVSTGRSEGGLPIYSYDEMYLTGPRAGTPVLAMLSSTNEIMHTDLTAIIVGSDPGGGPGSGRFPAGTFPPNVYTYPDREQAFREFVIMYHDEIGAVQAFPHFNDNVLAYTLHSGRDAFAINYGTGGIGAEVLANRLKVGPMRDCVECKYEEFFLTSWVVGDPAMIVDVPANSPCTVANVESGNTASCTPTQGPKATKAFYPDDPSNVYHSYLNDHTRFRVLHTGTKEHHIHHLHAHQWLYSPDNDESSYLDSQAIGPGASFTAEIAYNGSGNANRTPGDSIFHCHFYPHFAQGMWSLWRVHDVLETGTPLDANGRPAPGTRALPDGEIAAGTPIPGIVPLPDKPLPPLPKAQVSIVGGQVQIANLLSLPIDANPGYPFFIPARAGHRPMHPPMDTIDDGGLSRHIITGGTATEAHTRTDFHKTLTSVTGAEYAPSGSPAEIRAMFYHQAGTHDTCLPDGTCGVQFLTNGLAGRAGAPIAPPCTSVNRRYKAADIEDDVKINKAGWHFPQQRFTALWEDVDDFLGLGVPKKTPEPLFFRANSGDCIEYQLTNLVSNEYKQDDFQVRTPTDILGQHIHLVKFDVLASDGAANGFNYEDGSFAPEEVRERINALRVGNGCVPGDSRDGTFACPIAKVHPFFGAGPNGAWVGAQTTVQLWWADPVRDNTGKDRTLRTVFTHDHFGPSTHQQAGLYAGLVVEPAGSTWYHNETGVQLGNNAGRPILDGGPTSWQAVIDPPSPEPDYREFLLEFADFQLAYKPGSAACRAHDCSDPPNAVNPPGREEVGLPDLLERPGHCPTLDGSTSVAPPCPELISAADPGTMSVNYRNEPVALRVRNPGTNTQAAGQAGDLSYAFSSLVTRSDAALNVQPTFYPALTNDIKPKDPYTPILRALENDRVQIRVLVGAHEEGHNFSVHGIKWLFEPSEPNSGYRGSQMMGISEHFEFIVPQLIKNPTGDYVDRLWSAGSSTDDYWNGIWGLLRAYTGPRNDIMELPENPNGRSNIDPGAVGAYTFSCPKDAEVRTFDVSAVLASQYLPAGRLVYNSRVDGSFGALFDPTAILYVRTGDIDTTVVPNQIYATYTNRMEPLILRARAGECIKLTLRNKLPTTTPLDLDGYNTLPMIVDNFNSNDIKPSYEVGLHPQLVYFDPSKYDGANVGGNTVQTVAPGQFKTYEWYAGDITTNPDGTITATPIEFGAVNLISSDRIKHASKGAIGALIIEPRDAFISEHPLRRSEAFIDGVAPEPGFTEFVLVMQNDVNMRTDEAMTSFCDHLVLPPAISGGGYAVENLGCEEDPEDSGQKAINYRTEPLWKRMQHPVTTPFATTDDFTTWWNAVSNTKVAGAVDPQTPVYSINRNKQVRFRVLMPGGHSRNIVFALHGHEWDKEPYTANSTRISHNGFSFWEGAHTGVGPSNHFDAYLRFGAGGKFGVIGDYLYRDQVGIGFDAGLWGILRVLP